MGKNYLKRFISSILIAILGVFVIDYFSHLFFSEPMETIPYFIAKAVFYVIFSFLFLSFINLNRKESLKVVVGGVVVALLWGSYYNILPLVIGYYPFGIALVGLNFLGMGLFGTGVAFGTVHAIAFIGGYYASKLILMGFKKA